MKKILIICMVFMLLALCACRGNVADPTDPGVSQPANATEPNENDGTEPTGGGDTDSWETPIDVDDSFNEDDLQEPTSTEAPSNPTTSADPTDPTDPTEPSAPVETTKPTTSSPTTPAEPEPFEPTNKDGNIVLPLIPG